MIAPASRRKQRGLALFFLLALIGLVGGFLIINAMNRSGAELSQARDQKTQAALDRAKQALLTFAATEYVEKSMDTTTPPPPAPGNAHNPNRGVPGYLPCPELGPPTLFAEGTTAPICGVSGVSSIGRLPWYTLNTEPPREGSGECLWYAVSGTYKYTPNGVNVDPAVSAASNMMNWDTPGLFDVLASDGSTYLAGGGGPSTRAVAVIFAPGAALQGQNRSGAGGAVCGGNYTASNYLESANGVNNSAVSAVANAVTRFIAGQASNTFNDRLVYITRDELWAAIKKLPDSTGAYGTSLLRTKLDSLTQKVAKCVAEYGKHNNSGSGDERLPWTTLLSLSNPSYDLSYDDRIGETSGHVPYRVNSSAAGTGTNNSIPSPFYLFGTTSSASYCYSGGPLSDNDLNWYSNWKDHLFYALSDRFRPDSGSSSCGTCVRVNSGTRHAAIVMFAGERLAGQARDTPADRANIANYLEGANAANHPNSGGDGNYQSSPAGATFNDLLYCIRDNLSVGLCP